MIASRLPPSLFLGSIATTIHTPAFNCFVSTARRFFALRRWETVIFLGDPGVDQVTVPRMRFFYRSGLNALSIWAIHDAFCFQLNEMGDTGVPLVDAAAVVLDDLIRRDIVQNPLESARN